MTVPAHLRSTVAALGRDRAASELLGRLAGAGVEGILLKGPVLARLLYDDGAPRAYGDVDVLIDPADSAAARATLAGLGYVRRVAREDLHDPERFHAETWTRASDRSAVDLHVSLHGVGVKPEELWATVRPQARLDALCGAAVLVPSPALIALHVMTHAAQALRPSKPTEDLLRAIDRLPREVWHEAAGLARTLRATDTAVAGLRRAGPAGDRLAAELELRVSADTVARLYAHQAPVVAIGIGRICAARGLERWRRLRGYAVPSAEYMRGAFDVRGPGRLPLLRAHARRAGLHIRKLPAALAAWQRARAGS